MGLRILFESRYTWVCLYMLTGVLEVSPKWFTFGKLRALSTYHDLDEGLTSQYLLLVDEANAYCIYGDQCSGLGSAPA